MLVRLWLFGCSWAVRLIQKKCQGFAKRGCVPVLTAVVFLIASSLPAVAQSGPPQSPAPLTVLYEHFFTYQNHLDRFAATLASLGKDGSDFRNHFQQKMGFTDDEYALVRSAGAKLIADLAKQDAKAKAVIDAFHQAHPPGQVQSINDIPAPPPELTQLQKDRDQMILDEMTTLKSALSTTLAAKFDDTVKNEMSPQVSYRSIPVPPRNPASSPAPALKEQGVQ